MNRIKPLLDVYFRDRIDDCSDHPIPICKYDLTEALKELKSYEDNQEDIEILETVISILNKNKISMTEIIYHIEFWGGKHNEKS